jgi:hypothetical protein
MGNHHPSQHFKLGMARYWQDSCIAFAIMISLFLHLRKYNRERLEKMGLLKEIKKLKKERWRLLKKKRGIEAAFTGINY